MNILVITHTTPNTPSKDGMSLILYYLLKELTQRHTITLLSLDQYAEPDLLLSEVRSTVDKYDVIYIHGPQVLSLLPNLNQFSNLAVGLIDVQSYMYEQLAEKDTSSLQKRKWKKQQAICETFERDELSKVPHIIVGTDADKVALTKIVSGKPFVTVIPNGVDGDYFAPDEAVEKEHAIIFSGVIDQPSHQLSILYFYKHIWPILTKQDGQDKLKWYIVGKQPPKKILHLQNKDERIIITGFVPEVRDFLIRSKVFVSPLHLRSGIRNTALEALACGLPVVAFADACAGLESSPIRKVSTDADFANTVAQLLNNPEQLAEVGDNSRRYVQLHHTWEKQAQRYEQILEEVSHN